MTLNMDCFNRSDGLLLFALGEIPGFAPGSHTPSSGSFYPAEAGHVFPHLLPTSEYCNSPQTWPCPYVVVEAGVVLKFTTIASFCCGGCKQKKQEGCWGPLRTEIPSGPLYPII